MIQSLHDFMRKKKRVYCYGIGRMGGMLARYCRKHRLSIQAFLVSSREACKFEAFFSRPVHCVKDISITEEDGIILATVLRENIANMLDALTLTATVKSIYIGIDNDDFLHYFQRMNEKQRGRISRYRKKESLFHYMLLGEPISLMKVDTNPVEQRIYYSNHSYGQDIIVKKYVQRSFYNVQQCTILHAAQFLPEFTERELSPPDGNLFCMSATAFKEECPPSVQHIYELGPYILHVSPIISKHRIRAYKSKLGKTLLAAPSHFFNGPDGKAFDYDVWISEIERIKSIHGFQTVLVCLGPGSFYPKYRTYRFYQKKGYKIVTAGDVLDKYFLERLKAILLLADVVIGNDVSTLMGYSVSLGKPYYYYAMDIDETEARIHVARAGYNAINMDEWQSFKISCAAIFGQYQETISTEQLEFIKKFWGNKKQNLRKRKT